MINIENIAKFLLVSNMGDDSISLVDINNRKEIKKIYLSASAEKSGKENLALKKPRVGPHSIKIDRSNKNIYSVNCFDDSIAVIDAYSFGVKDIFFAGSHPNDIVLNNDESYAYVTNGDSDSVSIIDISSRKIVGQISVGVMPHGICISPDGEYIYVANMDSDSVSIIDTWSNSKIACIKVGRCPIEIVSSRDGRYLYVTCSFLGMDRNGIVSVISTNNYKVMKSIEVGSIPVQVRPSRDNYYLYVTNLGSNDVYVIDLNRLNVKQRIYTGNMTRGIVTSDEDLVYVTNSQDNNVSILRIEDWEVIANIEVGVEPTSMLYINRIN